MTRATQRAQRPHICPTCGSVATIRSSREIYGGRDYGLALICSLYPDCDTYVGCHREGPQAGIPLGTMADARLRTWRNRAHGAFDPLWKDRIFPSRGAAYDWMAQTLEIPRSRAHVAMLSAEECRRLVDAVWTYRKSPGSPLTPR